MPRKKGEPLKYSEEDLLKAAAEVQSGTSSMREIASKYNIPKKDFSV